MPTNNATIFQELIQTIRIEQLIFGLSFDLIALIVTIGIALIIAKDHESLKILLFPIYLMTPAIGFTLNPIIGVILALVFISTTFSSTELLKTITLGNQT